MEPWLYLDTARLGRMSPAAQRAQEDFARLAGEVGGAIQFENLLRHGFEACKSGLHHSLPGLASWQGIGPLKQSLRRLAGLDGDLPLLLAARSAELMKFAACLLCRPCANILVTDLGWSPYHRILWNACRRGQRRMTTVAIAHNVLRGRVDADEVVDRVCSEFVAHECDGLFLTSVSNCGARLPVGRIAERVGKRCRFIVVDGAQDFCHVGIDTPPECCDLYLAGCHKWLGGYHPLGLAVYGRTCSRKIIETVCEELLDDWQLDDPLLRYVEGIHRGMTCDLGETANLAALFSCAGAVQDATDASQKGAGLEARLVNADHVAEVAADAGWRPHLPDETLRSGIVILEGMSPRAQRRRADVTRTLLQDNGVVATAYHGGMLRLSMPAARLGTKDLATLRGALAAVS